MIVPDPRPFELDEYDGGPPWLVAEVPPRSFRIVRVMLRRSWLARLWRRLRRYFAGPS